MVFEIFLVLGVVLLILIFWPVCLSLHLHAHAKMDWFLSIKILWGLQVYRFPAERKGTASKSAREDKKSKSENGEKADQKTLWRFVRRHRHQILFATKRVLNQFHFRGVHGHIEYGFDDPATTGEVFGLISTIRGLLNKPQVNIIPNFMEKMLRGDIRATVVVIPFFLALTAVYYALKLAYQYKFQHLIEA